MPLNFHLCIRHTQIGTGTVPVRTPLYFCRHTGNFRIKLKQRYFLISYKTLATAFTRGCALLYIHRRLLQPSASVCPLFQEIIFVLYNYSKNEKTQIFLCSVIRIRGSVRLSVMIKFFCSFIVHSKGFGYFLLDI